MSRTDKDAPYWVRSEWYEPEHTHLCVTRYGRGRRNWSTPPVDCDLPAVAIRHDGFFWRPNMYDTRCYWFSEWPRRNRYSSTWGPKKKDRHLYWWEPDRARARHELEVARQQYRGYGDVEIVVTTQQHRHATTLKGGWWD